MSGGCGFEEYERGIVEGTYLHQGRPFFLLPRAGTAACLQIGFAKMAHAVQAPLSQRTAEGVERKTRAKLGMSLAQ